MSTNSRRSFLKKVAVGSATITLGNQIAVQAMVCRDKETIKKRVLRIAHITDIHLQPEGKGVLGFANALNHLNTMEDRPDLILNGGDTIMDSLDATKERTVTQWELFQKILSENNQIEIKHCIGNHDVWGWSHKDKSIRKDQLYGKNMAIKAFNIPNRYYRFNKADWSFIVLDSIHSVDGYGYTAKMDDEQYKWLEKELDTIDAKTPVCILSHIPLLTVCSYFFGENEKTGNWIIPERWMLIDARRIKDLFCKHPNVKLALSGHMHLQDKVEYLGVKYLCNGAVSGGWWKGKHQEFDPAFTIVDLYNDGSSTEQRISYQWQ